jgi:hypothetical protein
VNRFSKNSFGFRLGGCERLESRALLSGESLAVSVEDVGFTATDFVAAAPTATIEIGPVNLDADDDERHRSSGPVGPTAKSNVSTDPPTSGPVHPVAATGDPGGPLQTVGIFGDPTGPVMPTALFGDPTEIGPVLPTALLGDPVEPVLPTGIFGDPTEMESVMSTALFDDPTEIEPVMPTARYGDPVGPVLPTARYGDPTNGPTNGPTLPTATYGDPLRPVATGYEGNAPALPLPTV